MRTSPFPLAAALLLAGAAATWAAGPPSVCDLSGTWTGRWHSGSNDHNGPLRATFRKTDDRHYRVVFRGWFVRVIPIPFRFTVTMNVVGYGCDRVFLSGSSRLPIYGTFRYDATVTAREFHSTFRSSDDHGTFTLTRDE